MDTDTVYDSDPTQFVPVCTLTHYTYCTLLTALLIKKSLFKWIWYDDDELYYLMVIAIPSNRSLMSTWTRSNRINITCILLISTNSDKWMKAFRSMPYPCIGPNFEEIYLSLTDLVFPPQWLLPHPECWHIYRLYNDALYKIEKLTFTKDSLEKEKEISNIWVLKKENIIIYYQWFS